MQQHIKVHMDLANYAAEHNLLKAYAMYLSSKTKYRNSTVYTFNYNRLAHIFSIDPKTAKRYTRKLLDHNFATIHHGNITFRSPYKVMSDLNLGKYGSKEYYIRINKKPAQLPYYKADARPYTPIKNIYQRILYLMLRNNARQQEFMLRQRTDKSSGKIKLNEKEVRKIVRAKINATDKIWYARRMNIRYSIPESETLNALATEPKPDQFSSEKFSDIIISSSGAASLFGVSKTTASRYLKQLQRKRWITLRPVIEKIAIDVKPENAKSLAADLTAEGNGYYYSYNGNIYKHYGQSLNFILKYKKKRFNSNNVYKDKIKTLTDNKVKLLNNYSSKVFKLNKNYTKVFFIPSSYSRKDKESRLYFKESRLYSSLVHFSSNKFNNNFYNLNKHN